MTIKEKERERGKMTSECRKLGRERVEGGRELREKERERELRERVS